MGLSRNEFAELVLRYVQDLTSFTRRLTKSAADADDLLQSTYEQAFRSWKSLQKPSSCRAWLFRIARNLRIDAVRARTARPELVAMEDNPEALPPDLSIAPIVGVEAVDLERALERLPDEQRETVLLCDLWGFRYEEISEITNVPIGTVRSRLSRARASLLRLLSTGHKARSQQP